MSDLHLDFAALRSLTDRLTWARTRLLGASHALRDAAGTVGHAGLAARLSVIADELDLVHGAAGQRIELLADACATITARFETVDARLAEAGAGSEPATVRGRLDDGGR